MTFKTSCVAAAALATISSVAFAQASTVVSGSGSAPVTRDTNAVRAQAEALAKADLVRAFARQVIGAERMGELTPEMVDQLAVQIRNDMIVDRSSERVGNAFNVTLSASIDRQWFQSALDDLGVASSSRRGGGQQQRIVVMIDEAIGVAPDFSQPAEIVTEYDRDSGSSFSDKSTLAYSNRERSGSSSSSASGQSSQGRYAGAASGARGSVAVSGAASQSSAQRSRASSASSSDTALIDRTNIEASTHDDVRFRQRITFQSAANSATGRAAVSALTEGLVNYDIGTASVTPLMAAFQPGPTPLFTELQSSGKLSAFFQYAQSQSAPFFMSGALEINHGGRHPATGEVECTGAFNADAYSTATGQNVGSAFREATGTGRNSSDCENRLTTVLAGQVAAALGPQIQREWRNVSRAQTSAIQSASAPAEYTLTVRGNDLNMGVQADLLDALGAIPGVDQHAFLGQDARQINIHVKYSGSTPLHLALFQRLRGNPAFAAMQSQTAPQQVILCLNGC